MTRVLVTGGSSFTGEWIVRSLAASNDVFVAVTQAPQDYEGLRSERVARIEQSTTVLAGVRHDDESLAAAIASVKPDVIVHHAHPMAGFRDATYDSAEAFGAMTRHLESQMAAASGAKWLYSGTVYEPTPDRPAVSGYGVSKSAVWEALRESAARHGVDVGRVTIPNPFGPSEEGRIGNYLASQWKAGATPVVRSPRYVRDNIPVTELAECYSDLVANWSPSPMRPSGYVETMGDFVARVAREVGARWGRELPFELTPEAPHPEPLTVVNGGDPRAGWASRESAFWDAYADYLADGHIAT